MDTLGTHGLSCHFSTGCHFRHAMLNDILHGALSSANVPSRLEPTGLDHVDGMHPDGITMVSLVEWQIIGLGYNLRRHFCPFLSIHHSL